MLLKRKELSTTQMYGSGLAAILICLILYLWLDNTALLYLAIGITVLSMIWAAPLRYFGVAWFAFGDALGWVVSRIMLTVIYLIVVLPVSLFVKRNIKRRMLLSSFKRGTQSVFKQREHLFTAGEFEKPF